MRLERVPTAARGGRPGRLAAGSALGLVLSLSAGCRSAAPEWSGAGAWRILVEVAPAAIGSRASDEGVARLEVPFAAILAAQGVEGEVDLASLQVHRYDPRSGAAERFKPFESARSPYDRPCRFEDAALPEDYPSRVGRASYEADGRAPLVMRKRKARLFNREMDTAGGTLLWVHTQEGNQPAHYAVYFDVAPRQGASGPSPAPWIGDVDVLRRASGQPLVGLSHAMVAAGDLDGDGLFDLVTGAEKGDLLWFPNHGRPGAPKFVGCRVLTDEAGPIDVGFYSSPFVYDWDNDGLPDLLVGTSSNVILWWQNTGDRRHPRFAYKGFVEADGRRLEVPEGPAPEVKVQLGGTVAGTTPGKPSAQRDYFNQPWVGDWNGDGLPDILAGGYITGLVFQYRATGRDAQGVPILHYVGPVEADGRPLDTVWSAAPAVADFDGDGRLDLVTGSWWWSGIPYPPKPGQVDYLLYFAGGGTPAAPRLMRRPLPHDGDLPDSQIVRPAVVDWNGDGLLDLVASNGGIRVLENVGTKTAPRFRVAPGPLEAPWGFVPHAGFSASMADVDHDGRIDALEGTSVTEIRGSPYSPEFLRKGTVTSGGAPISHPGPGYGDLEYYTVLHDWDGDGRYDLLWGTQQGNIWLHRASAAGGPMSFEPGIELRLTSGQDLKVGPPVVDPRQVKDFTVLQGARIKFTVADFDRDGIDDLAVIDTYRDLTIFRNTRKAGTDTLAPGVKVGKLHHVDDAGGTISAFDWDRDGRPDIVTGGTSEKHGETFMNRSRPGHPEFSEPVYPIALPYVFWGPKFMAVDWNGDGDEDLLIQSEFYSMWAERSFLERGYSRATQVRVERRR